MEIYIDSTFSKNELIEFVVPIIIRANNNFFVDFYNYIALYNPNLNLVKNEKLLDIHMNVYEINTEIDFDNLQELTKENSEIFFTRNFIAKKALELKINENNNFLRYENSISSIELIISLNTNFLIDNPEIFSYKNSEKILDLFIYIKLLDLSKKYNYLLESKGSTMIYKINYQPDFNLFLDFWNNFVKLNSKLTPTFLNRISNKTCKKIKNIFTFLPQDTLKELVLKDEWFINKLFNEITTLKRIISEEVQQ
ncbi:hypothetical protein Ob7_09437 [Thermosipho africanus Ob7]|uniref:hypothetical protein n=1 Tax=Thermosipho africanus TaxID=2421 RepID=UPI000E0A0A75|nr:hypothetical protein [Thermosipho africanus]RDI90215.1 hypothetical protein Ob7_09437 [Thermosipho africanus Ob7]